MKRGIGQGIYLLKWPTGSWVNLNITGGRSLAEQSAAYSRFVRKRSQENRRTRGSAATRFAASFVSVASVVGILVGASAASAKDLTNRLGVGYENQFSVDLPSVAVQYYPAKDLAVSAGLGIDTQDEASRFGFMARLNKIVFEEDNLNFYMGAGAGLLSTKAQGASNESGFELAGFLGAEFFLPGLESLGFSFEAGAAVTSLRSGVRFRTFGDSPLRAGMIFYF